MALSTDDETNLLLPLIGGAQEDAPFSTFLERLRARTGAEHVSIIIHQKGTAVADEAIFFAGIDLRGRARELGFEPLFLLDGVHHEKLRPNRVYSVAEFTDHDPEIKQRRAAEMQRLGILDERVIRLPGDAGYNVSMAMARGQPCSASDSALLSNVAPYVASAVRMLHSLSKQRSEAETAFDAIRRAGTGWLLLDGEARIVAVEPATAARLSQAMEASPRIGERLLGIEPDAERMIIAAATRAQADPHSSSQIVQLIEEPSVEALLTPVRRDDNAAFAPAVLAAYCRFPQVPSDATVHRFASLFDLARREAELAILLARGSSIAEASAELGLTIETTRNYTKRLYSKLGLRSQSDVVRLVLESAAMLES